MFICLKKMSDYRLWQMCGQVENRGIAQQSMLQGKSRGLLPRYGRMLSDFIRRSACRTASWLLFIGFHPGKDFLEICPGIPMIGGGFQDVLIMRDGFPVFAGLGQTIG